MINSEGSAGAAPTVLYVFDDDAKEDVDLLTDKRVVICPISTDYQRIENVFKAIKGRSSREVTVVNFAEFFNAKAFAIRSSFTAFIAEFAGKPICFGRSIKRYMADKSGRFSFWWLTPIAEKNTVASPAYDRLAALLTILDIARSHSCAEICVDISDAALVRGLKANCRSSNLVINVRQGRFLPPALRQAAGIMKAFIQLGKLVIKNISARRIMRRTNGMKKPADAEYLFVTPFPLFNEAAWAQGRFSNNYFGPFQTELEKKYPDKTAWFAMFVRLENTGWHDGLKLGRRIDAGGYPLSFLEQWLTLSDFWSVTIDTIRSAFKFSRCRERLARDFIFDDAGAKVNVWSLFEADWYDSLSGRGLLLGLVNFRAFRRVIMRLAPGTTIIYPAEMLAWEKALNLAAAARSDLQVVGIQHTTVPLMLLTYSVDRSELNADNAIDALPAPHRLACVGPVANDLLLSSGWDSDRVFPWVAVRYGHFRELLSRTIAWSDRRRTVILALPAAPLEARELFYFAWQALAGSDVRVAVKAHPLSAAEPLAESLGLVLDGTNFEISFDQLGDLLVFAKAMVVTGSSAALESLACGCSVIIPRLAHSIDRNALSGISDLPVYVNSPMELRKVVSSIIDAEEPPVSIEESRAFIKRYLNLPESDVEWLANFEEAVAGC